MRTNSVKLTGRKLATLTLLGATALPAVPAAATEIVFNVFTGPRHFINDPFKAWAKEIQEATKGRVTVKFLPTSAAPPPKQIDGVVSGQFDAAFIFHGFTGKRAVGPQFGILPFVLDGNAEAGSVAYQRAYDKFFGAKNEFGKVGLKILSMFQFPGGNFYSNDDKPIMSVADMKVRKMWVLAGTPSRTLKGAGVNHVSGPAARVNEFTQTNVVDGLAGISMDGVRAFGALNFTKTTTLLDGKIQAASFAMFMSEKKWKEISAGDQKAIMAASGEKIARAVGKRSDVAEEESRQAMLKSGIKFHKGPANFKTELLKAGEPLIEDWIKAAKAKGVDGKAVLDFYAAEVKKAMAGK